MQPIAQDLVVEAVDVRMEHLKMKLVEETKEVRFGAISPLRIVRIGSLLPVEVRGPLLCILEENVDVFAWQLVNLVGVDPRVVTHNLNCLAQKTKKSELKHWRSRRPRY